MLTIEVTGLDELRAKLEALEAALDVEDILDESEALLLNRIRARFLAEEGPDAPWPESKAAKIRKAGGYTVRKGKKYTGTGTLFESGTLFHSIHAYSLGPGERAIGTDVRYAPFHQFGLPGFIPPRPFLGFSDEDIGLVEGQIVQRMAEALA